MSSANAFPGRGCLAQRQRQAAVGSNLDSPDFYIPQTFEDGLRRGGGLVVSFLAVSSDDLSSNPAGNKKYLYKKDNHKQKRCRD